MRGLHRLRLRFRSLLRRDQVDAELRAELDFHLERETADLVARGIDPVRAREAARRALGDLSRFEEECRDARGTRGLEILAQDTRYGLRAMRSNPVFTALAVLSLAVGIGANTAIFSLIDALLLRRLPVHAPDELVVIGNPARTGSMSQGQVRGDLLSEPLYRALTTGARSFRGVLASGRAGRLVVGGAPGAESSERTAGRLVSGNYFDVLGVGAQLGRTFGVDDDRKGAAPVAVISDDYWSRRFARDPEMVGRRLRLNGHEFAIVGVAPRGFLGDVTGTATDIWVPIAMQPQLNPGRDYLGRWDTSWLLLIGRRAPGVTLESARQEILARYASILATRDDGAIDADLVRDIGPRHPMEVSPGAGGVSGLRDRFAQPLRALAGLVALVLLIACVNIASLLLARADLRHKEISVRLALGAGRARLVRQLLTESLLLAVAGGALGLVVALWSDRVLLRLVGLQPSAALASRPDARVLGFTALVSLLTGILFGLVPALRATSPALAPALRERARGVVGGQGGGNRNWPVGKVLVVAQLALSLLLLTFGGLFVRTLANLQRVEVGYSVDRLLVVGLDPVAAGYRPEQFPQLADRVQARLRELPGVENASFSENGLFAGTDSGTTIAIAGRPPLPREQGDVAFDRVSGDYFATTGIPLRSGRGILATDRTGSPAVAVVNESMARRLFPGGTAIGQRFHEIDHPDRDVEVVGVAGDAHDHDLRRPVEPRYYLALAQSDEPVDHFNFQVRTAQPRQLVNEVRAAVQRLDPRLPILDISPLGEYVAENVRYDRLVAKLASVFGLVALLLAAIGLYGVVSLAVARRTNEIGVRLVLGAEKRGVLGMVIGETLVLALVGSACGLPVAIAGGRLIASRLFGISAHDLPTIAAAVATLVAIALLAGGIPGLRAARLEPTVALRQE